MKAYGISMLATLIFVSVPSITRGGTDYSVPDPYPQVDDAMAVASGGDRILITSNEQTLTPFTVSKAVEVLNTSSEEVIIDGSSSTFAARITASGGKITGLTLRGGTQKVVDVGPGTVRYCRIEDVTGQLQYDYAVIMASSGGQLLDSRIVRTTGVKSVNVTASGAVRHCYFDITGSSGNDDSAIRVAAGSVTVEEDTVNFASLQHTRWGIELTTTSGNDVVDYNYIVNANKGIYVYHPNGGSTYFRYNILDGCSYGIWFDAGTGETVERNTVFRATNDAYTSGGIRLNSNVSSSTLSRNLFINVDTGILCGGATNMTYNHNVYAEGSDGSASSCGLSSTEIAGMECILCEARESSVEFFTQRIDSETALGNNGWNEVVGAKDVECAWGSLVRNSTIPQSTQVTVLEDLTIPSDKTLTVGAGAQLKFDGVDNSEGGFDEEKNELVVNGILDVNGTSQSYAKFISSAVSPAEGDWYGIRTTDAGYLFVTRAEVKNAVYGIHVNDVNYYLQDVPEVTFCTFASNQNYDVYVDTLTVPLSFKDNTFTVGGGSGIYVDIDQLLVLQRNALTGNSSSTAGILVENSNSEFAMVSNTASGFTNGAGIKILDGDVNLRENVLYGSQYGVHLTGGSAEIGTTSSSSDNEIFSNTYGVFVEATQCSVGYIAIRNNYIHDNSSTGVFIDETSSVDMGTTSDHGNNWIENNFVACIWHSSSCGTVQAVGNYFGECPTSPCTIGSVNTASKLCTVPASVNAEVEPVPPGDPLRLEGVCPNPFASSGDIRFMVGEKSRIRVDVFDVGGRLVRAFDEREFDAGPQFVHWNGQSNSGESVSDGIYFVRVTLNGNLRQSTKVMVAR